MLKLQTNGFIVFPWKDNYLYIDWSMTKTDCPEKTTKTTKNITIDELDEKIRKIKR